MILYYIFGTGVLRFSLFWAAAPGTDRLQINTPSHWRSGVVRIRTVLVSDQEFVLLEIDRVSNRIF